MLPDGSMPGSKNQNVYQPLSLLKNRRFGRSLLLIVLASVFPPIFLYSRNYGRFPLSVMIPPAIIIAIVCVALWMVSLTFTKRHEKSALIIAINLLFFFSYGDMAALMHPLSISFGDLFSIGYRKLYCCLFVILNGALFVILKRMPGIELVCSKMIQTTVVVAIIISLGTLAFEKGSDGKNDLPRQDERLSELLENAEMTASSSVTPDIYHIILDAHPRTDILQEYFNHDNSRFIGFLKDHGFVVPRYSWSNYAHTDLSIPATLNFSYIHDNFPGNDKECASNRQYAYGLRAEALVMRFLQKKGYQVYLTENGFESAVSGCADHILKPNTGALEMLWDEFNYGMVRMTPARIIMESSRFPRVSFFVQHRRRIRYALDFLSNAHKEKGPKYVLAHIVAPHTPIVFGPNGEELQQGPHYLENPSGDTGKFIEASRNEVMFLDSIVAQTISRMIAADSNCVIILQSDHGEFAQWPQEEYPDTAVLKQRHGILNALRIPGRQVCISDTMTAINTYPMVLNALFGTTIPQLQDRVFYSSIASPFKVFDISTKLGLEPDGDFGLKTR
ncbi:MAG: hypothetical protein GX556_16615 [Fibrobacter sp.]|nr:hypothetical protein [Fibrobacter sp.]